MRTRILTVDDLRFIVDQVGLDRVMDDVIEGLTCALLEYDTQRYDAPARDGFEYSEPATGLLEWMPALDRGSCATLKVVGYHPTNPRDRGLPTILSVALTLDTRSGHLAGIVDATFATALRTGAASALASRVLSAPGARVLGLIGCGGQAVSQLHGLSRVFDFDAVLVYDIDPRASESFCDRAARLGLDALVRVAPPEEVARAAEILCTATSVEIGKGPVVADEGIRPDVHVNAVGSDFPGKLELPRSLLERSLVCPDFREQALREGECQQLAAEQVGPDLVDLVRDSARYEQWRARSTVFDSTGWALEDHVTVGVLLQHADRLGCGSELAIESLSRNPLDPYGFLEIPRSARALS